MATSRIVKGLRKQTGDTLSLVAGLALILVVFGLGIFSLSMMLGGSKEARSAVEAGALNVGKQVLSVTVPAQGSDQQQFSDVADSNGNFGLKNIDRVWAKALLAAINESAMEQEGSQSSTSASDSQALQTAAQQISTQLSQQLNQASNLYGFFSEFAQPGSVRMLGKNAVVDTVADNNWQTALLNRGDEGNVSVDTSELPSNFDASSLNLVAGKDGNQYLPGYSQIQVTGQNFWFVPFKLTEKPHLVAANTFQQDTLASNPISWTDPVPNAFSVHGGVNNSNDPQQQAIASVLANSQLYFKMQMPQAFVRLKVQANTLQWNLNGIDMESDSYGFLPGDTHTSYPYPLPCGEIHATEYCGNEYLAGPTLFTALFALPPIPGVMDSSAFDHLLQRAQEIHPGLKQAELIALLVATPISTNAQDQEFILYPASAAADAPLIITPASSAPSWTNTQPDGSQELLETEGPIGPNQGYVELDCYGAYEYPTVSTISGERNWTPGTGYDGCLGTLNVHRTTTAYVFGFCSCP